MKRLCLIILFLLISIPKIAYSANWIKVATSSRGDTLFVDALSIQRDGNVVTFWTKTNYATRTQYGDLSSKVQESINCKSRENKRMFSMYYDDFDNQGKVTSSGKVADQSWNPIPPETINDAIRRFVCKSN